MFSRPLARTLLLATGLFAVVPGSSAQDRLPATVRSALDRAGIPRSSVAAVVHEIGMPQPRLLVNAVQPMNPASVMKLVTTYAALELLGPAYRWRTEAYVRGKIAKETLRGQMIFKGYGDPKLSHDAFWLMLRAIRDRGVRDVRGDVVFDRSHFQTGAQDGNALDGAPLRAYNVGPDALLLNQKAVWFHFVPDPDRRAVRVIPVPRLPAIDAVSMLRLSNGACGEWRDRLRGGMRTVDRTGGRLRVIFTGTYPESCGELQLSVALLSHPDYAARLFRQTWREIGGAWIGNAQDGPVPEDARLIYRHESPALAEIVRDINKSSNNVMARQLFLTLGTERVGPPGRPETSFAAVRAWLADKKLDAPELAMENGSGLSRAERLSAQTLAQLLLAAYRSPVMPEFIASLPLAAVDGTMRARLKDEPAAGQAHIKTGALYDVRSIAGYVLDRQGRRQVVVMIINHPEAAQAQEALDGFLRWVYDPRSVPG